MRASFCIVRAPVCTHVRKYLESIYSKHILLRQHGFTLER
jgi:hypothetical protein